MDGALHYRTAEILLANLRDEFAGKPGTLLRTPEQRAEMREEALAHATLALAAATAETLAAQEDERTGNRIYPTWAEAIA